MKKNSTGKNTGAVCCLQGIKCQFCPWEVCYCTVTEWERGTRGTPEYVLRLLEYYVQHNCPEAEEAEK